MSILWGGLPLRLTLDGRVRIKGLMLLDLAQPLLYVIKAAGIKYNEEKNGDEAEISVTSGVKPPKRVGSQSHMAVRVLTLAAGGF